MSRRQYAWHRWLGAVIGFQLFAWTLGGLVFATHDIGWIHGDEGRNFEAVAPLDARKVQLSPADAVTRVGDAKKIKRIVLRTLLGEPVYAVEHAEGSVLVDARDGKVRSPIDEKTAVSVALADRSNDPGVASVARIDADPPIEYREKPLPAWRVSLDDGEGTNVWVAANTGLVTARRNDAWRRFDFFWMLHTMDYGSRDDFNHPLLIVFASLALISVLSGGLLWATRVRRQRKRKKA